MSAARLESSTWHKNIDVVCGVFDVGWVANAVLCGVFDLLLGGGKDREAGGPIMFVDVAGVDEANEEIVVSRAQVGSLS